jgi:hypothetical protein
MSERGCDVLFDQNLCVCVCVMKNVARKVLYCVVKRKTYLQHSSTEVNIFVRREIGGAVV